MVTKCGALQCAEFRFTPAWCVLFQRNIMFVPFTKLLADVYDNFLAPKSLQGCKHPGS